MYLKLVDLKGKSLVPLTKYPEDAVSITEAAAAMIHVGDFLQFEAFSGCFKVITRGLLIPRTMNHSPTLELTVENVY